MLQSGWSGGGHQQAVVQEQCTTCPITHALHAWLSVQCSAFGTSSTTSAHSLLLFQRPHSSKVHSVTLCQVFHLVLSSLHGLQQFPQFQFQPFSCAAKLPSQVRLPRPCPNFFTTTIVVLESRKAHQHGACGFRVEQRRGKRLGLHSGREDHERDDLLSWTRSQFLADGTERRFKHRFCSVATDQTNLHNQMGPPCSSRICFFRLAPSQCGGCPRHSTVETTPFFL